MATRFCIKTPFFQSISN